MSLKKIPNLEAAPIPFLAFTPDDSIHEKSIHLLGFRFDGTSCFRKGSDLGPNALREASEGYEEYSPYLNLDTRDRSLIDLGNLPHYPDDWYKTHDFFQAQFGDLDLKKHQISLITVGGEHSVSYDPISLYLKNYPDLFLVHLDAHADLRDGYQGYEYSHASIIRRVSDVMGPDHQLLQYGIRSGTREEFEEMNERKTQAKSRAEFLERLSNIDPSTPIYLTLDLDYFDPSFLPGTGTPEAGGEDFHSFIAAMKILKTKNFVGADVVELAPELDSTNNSSCFAAKVVREIILALKHP